ncbi:TPA: phage tail protein [Escherichia coli]|uniref:phage tail protein n=10 Tax=Escherichia coli TaxID=562 RepID=UPI000DA4EBE6|nr:phage tail protein [Escherichia coli]EEF5438040.1 phage tail protein [Salmonella enterica]EFA3578607.1 phage tail protein [Escherichia coli]EFA3996707.1 phage tail protein [Escherichia coli]EFB1825755.1 phage tail protein [Escherichia coli]EFC0897753.1 phage tail protein [Escherichia coli]
MFYIDNDSGVTVMPPVSAQRSAIVRWFSEGDGNNVITWPGMDWFNIVQAELLNTLEEAGIQPDKTKLNQLALSIKAIMSNNALLIKNNLSEIKTAGASAQRTARENLDIYDASLNKKGLVQLTSATDSPSETLAATAKAVKIAMDNANARLAKDRNGADIPNKPLFIQNVGLRELGTSGEKIPLLSTANTWTNRQTFSGGLSGELSGNASTAAKLKTARKISNVAFDGSSDITLKAGHVGAFALGKTGSTVANDKAVGWNWSSGAYNAAISGASTLIIHFYMGEGSCPAAQFRINYKNGGIFYRSARDGYGFEADWSEFYTTTRKPSAGDVGAYTKAECNSRFITGVRLGGLSSVQTWNGPGWSDRSGYVVTGSVNGNRDELIDTTQARPIQYCINGTWYNAGSI